MNMRSIRAVVVIAGAIVVALAGADRASAAGAVLISTCQTLTDTNTTYKLTTDLTSCNDCLVVATSKITIDLQGHSITNTVCPGSNAAISDQGSKFDLIVVKNGKVAGYDTGVRLSESTRVSVLGVTAKDSTNGILAGPQALVKSSEASGNSVGIVVRDRGQVQQCNAHDNAQVGIAAFGDNCLITMNTANNNDGFGIVTINGNRCTVSYNTASNNGFVGIDVGAGDLGGTGHLVTQNVALDNDIVDYTIKCPSDVTNNTSTNGFPASYEIDGTGCHFVNNN
jgi:parallel beta helix pectate lyase-like protein